MNDNLVAKSYSLSHIYGVKMNENLVAKEVYIVKCNTNG